PATTMRPYNTAAASRRRLDWLPNSLKKRLATRASLLVIGVLVLCGLPQISSGFGLAVTEAISFNGNLVGTDSFNSTNDLYSTGGLYDPTKALDHGDVLTSSTDRYATDIGSGKIKGSLHARGAGSIIHL